VSVELQKNDIHCASTSEEISIGIRVFKRGAIGFVNVNSVDAIEAACREALILAEATPSDPLNALRAPEAAEPLPFTPDPAIESMGIEDVVTLANEMLVHVTSKDDRVMIDSGEVATGCSERAIANSLGLRCSEKSAIAGGSLFGMAVDGRDVGSFDYDGQNVTLRESLRQELLAAADRFMIKTIGALRACAGETFRGPIILTPEVVAEFIVGNLTSVMSAKSVRLSKSPFKGRLSERVVSPLISLWDEPRLPGGVASQSFDREGTPTKRIALLEEGVLRSFLFDVYESRSQKVAPTGHARGGAGGVPSIGPSNLVMDAGDQSFSRLCTDPKRAIVVSRFSGNCSPITGEFSGVVKGGFLMQRGERIPIKETLIAGNLYEALQRVSGISSETRLINGRLKAPAVRLEDISITAG
jgi:PmbA protein